MNFRPLVNEQLREFEKELPNYSLAETFLAILKVILKDGEISPRTILKVSDEQIYSAINKTIKREKEE